MPRPKQTGTFVRKIIYGSSAAVLKRDSPTFTEPADPLHTHRWSVYVMGHHGADISHFVKKVTFKLHQDFPDPLRIVTQPPFEVNETGWGEFDIVIRIYFHDTSEKPIALTHTLQLYTIEPKDGAVPPPPAVAASKRAVIAERYEEIVFHRPSEALARRLQEHEGDPSVPSSPSLPTHAAGDVGGGHFSAAMAAEEAELLARALVASDREVLQMTEELQAADAKLRSLRQEISRLEREAEGLPPLDGPAAAAAADADADAAAAGDDHDDDDVATAEDTPMDAEPSPVA